MIETTAIYVQIYDNVFLFYLIRKERIPSGKTALVYGKLHLDVTDFVKLFISLVVANCQSPSPFCIYLEHGTYVCIGL